MTKIKTSLAHGLVMSLAASIGQAAFGGTLPLRGTDMAAKWDFLYDFLFWLSVFFFILVVVGMIIFAVKYRERPGIKTRYITDNHLLEAFWIFVPTALLMVIFVWGYSVYHQMVQPPSDAMEIRVIGKQWLWTFQYDNGKTTVGEVFVPVNKPVKLIMTSEDVLHGFFIPNFRIKQDVVPGMYTSLWFEATVPGKHQVFCTEYCGTSHSGMLAKVVVLDERQWEDWNSGKKLGAIPEAGIGVAQADSDSRLDATSTTQSAPMSREARLVSTVSPSHSLALQGKQVYELKGCTACHTVDGTIKVGPSHRGIYGKREELSDGSFVLVDDNYLRESIENPSAKIVKGYQPQMPTFKGLLSENEMNAVIAYIKSLK